jgi:hypothetical protein
MAAPPRFPIDQALDRLHADLGHRQLNKIWAKIEIFLGLFAMGGGMLLGEWTVTKSPDSSLAFTVVSLTLFVLGGYLALAGNRSHLYQSNNRLAAYLAELISKGKMEEDTDECERTNTA